MKKNLLRQKLLEISRKVVDTAVMGEDPDEMLRSLQKSVFELNTSGSKDSSDPERDVEEWVDYVMKGCPGSRLSIRTINRHEHD